GAGRHDVGELAAHLVNGAVSRVARAGVLNGGEVVAHRLDGADADVYALVVVHRSLPHSGAVQRPSCSASTSAHAAYRRSSASWCMACVIGPPLQAIRCNSANSCSASSAAISADVMGRGMSVAGGVKLADAYAVGALHEGGDLVLRRLVRRGERQAVGVDHD